MDPLIRDVLIFGVAVIALIFSGVPIAFALCIVAISGLYFTFGSDMFLSLAYVGWTSLGNFLIGAIPMFVLMGYLLFETGLSTRVYDGVSPLLNRLLPGGLLHTNIVVGALFAASSGSSAASCATIGAVALPEMERQGYSRNIAAGSVAAGSTLGILIPPSVCLIVYGLMASESIGKLFIGGIIPGLILTATYMAYIAVRIKLQPSLSSGIQHQKQSWGFCLLALLKVWPMPLLILAVMGAIYTGMATPTEAAAIGCTTVFFLAAGYRLINYDALKRTTRQAIVTSSMILMIYLGGKMVGVYLAYSGITAGVAARVGALGLHPLVIFMGVMVMYIIMGMLMDGLAMMVLTIPVMVPVMSALGFNPIWFGVVLTMLAECSLLTPPVGVNLFILKGLRPEYPFMQIVKGCFPFFLVLLANIFLMVAFPQLITFLPGTMIK